jgi:hypothetical protein
LYVALPQFLTHPRLCRSAGDIVQTEVEKQEADKKAAAAAEVERKAAAAAAAARAKALEDEKVKAYLEQKAAMEAAKVRMNSATAFFAPHRSPPYFLPLECLLRPLCCLLAHPRLLPLRFSRPCLLLFQIQRLSLHSHKSKWSYDLAAVLSLQPCRALLAPDVGRAFTADASMRCTVKKALESASQRQGPKFL